ncbi:MAG TPA: MIP family channel protein [Gemmataceae bacterium]|nr:MIP family channel protein [Gemmataceae bacterium]
MPLARRCFAELLGTFVLIVCGCGAVVVNQVTATDTLAGALTHPGIALVWGLVVLALVYTLGDLSGCHINPAVTLGFTVAGRFPWKEAVPYMAAQVAGAFAASLLLKGLFPTNATLGATLPAGDVWQSFTLEVFLTWFLMLAVLGVSTGAKEKGITAGIAVGAIIGLEAMFAGPICGASMNPARSLAPAVVSGNLTSLWIYLTAPVLGAAAAVPFWKLLRTSDIVSPNDCV